jgi:hypothetical protein
VKGGNNVKLIVNTSLGGESFTLQSGVYKVHVLLGYGAKGRLALIKEGYNAGDLNMAMRHRDLIYMAPDFNTSIDISKEYRWYLIHPKHVEKGDYFLTEDEMNNLDLSRHLLTN